MLEENWILTREASWTQALKLHNIVVHAPTRWLMLICVFDPISALYIAYCWDSKFAEKFTN